MWPENKNRASINRPLDIPGGEICSSNQPKRYTKKFPAYQAIPADKRRPIENDLFISCLVRMKPLKRQTSLFDFEIPSLPFALDPMAQTMHFSRCTASSRVYDAPTSAFHLTTERQPGCTSPCSCCTDFPTSPNVKLSMPRLHFGEKSKFFPQWDSLTRHLESTPTTAFGVTQPAKSFM